jgi:hypothetical protein
MYQPSGMACACAVRESAATAPIIIALVFIALTIVTI